MDLYTLHIEHAVLLGLFTILTLINCYLHKGSRGMYWFPAYTLLLMLGAVLIALRGHISEPVSIVLGMTFFHLAYLCLYCCLQEFFERRLMRWAMPVQIAAVTVSFGALLQYGFFHPDTHKRLIVFSLVFSLQMAFSARLVFRHAEGFLRIPGALMGAILICLCGNNLVRAIGTMITGAPANYLHGGPMLQWALLMTTVLQGGITVAFVWMTTAVLHEDLRILAATDSLTGLLNRRALDTAARQLIASSLRGGTPLSAIMIDLDHFKKINDTFGHPFGSAALVQVAECLQRQQGNTHLLGRIGGDEFALVLEDTDYGAARLIAEDIRSSLERLHLVQDTLETRVTASIGVAQLEERTGSWESLMIECDRALYDVKEAGGNLVLSRPLELDLV